MQTHPSGHYPSVSQPTHVWDYWAVVMKRFLLVLLFCAGCVGASFLITRQQQKLYRATAKVEILPPSMLGAQETLFTPAIVNDDKYLRTQLMILSQPETVNQAVKDESLETKPDFAGKTAVEIARMAYGKVECAPLRDMYIVEVSVVGPEPKVLDDLCNALVRTFQKMQKSETRKLREDRKAIFEEQKSLADSNIRLLNSDKKTALQNQNFTETTFESEYEKIQQSRERFLELADKLYAELMQEESDVNAIKAARENPATTVDSIAQLLFIRDNAKLKEIDESLQRLADDRRMLIEKDQLGPNEPRVRAMDRAIEQANRDRSHLVEREAARFVVDHEHKRGTYDGYQRKIEQRTQELNAAAQVKSLIDEKNAEINRNRDNKDAAIRQLEILAANADDEKDAVRIQSLASEPGSPYSPNAAANLMMGVIFGIVGGVALAFLLDYLDDTIRTKDELAKVAADVPLLGIVPNIEARKSEIAKKDLYAANQPKSTISEAYRGVRTALTLSARGPQQKAMLLTSAGPREGKTTTAINLATVLAFSGGRTLIIDADLRKPRVHSSFNLPNKKGLTNLIVTEDDPVEYCQKTHVDRVDVLTSGPIPPNPSELLGRPRMREILRRLREHYDQIIVDTPPIGAVTDAAVIATMVDGVILVVHAGKTRRQIVSRGIEQLRYIGAPIIGVILNNLHLGRGRYYPGYYHYYYYYASHYGAEDGESRKGKSKQPPSAPAGTSAGGGASQK